MSTKNFSKVKAFTYDGFGYWNKAIARFKIHQNSEEHKTAILKVIDAPKAAKVDEIFEKNSEIRKEKKQKMPN